MTGKVEVIGSENLQRFIAGRSVAIVGAMRGAILSVQDELVREGLWRGS